MSKPDGVVTFCRKKQDCKVFATANFHRYGISTKEKDFDVASWTLTKTGIIASVKICQNIGRMQNYLCYGTILAVKIFN